jgi:hypothetical protein
MIFACNFWAVVRVDIAHAPSGAIVEQDTLTNLEGLWDTEEAAARWASEQDPITEKPSYRSEGDTWETEQYVLVSCHGLKLAYIGELESQCEAVAKAKVLGVQAVEAA